MERLKIDDMIKDYSWMLNVITNYMLQLDYPEQKLIAQYGIEAAMPKAQGANEDPILKVVERREQKWQKVERYQKKIDFVDQHSECIKDEGERYILDSILRGDSLAEVSRDMGISWKQAATKYDNILDMMVTDVEKGENGEKVEKVEKDDFLHENQVMC